MTPPRTPPPAGRPTRRALLAAAAPALAGSLLAAACAPGATSGPPQDTAKAVTLTWAVRSGGTPEARQALLAELKSSRPHLTVEQIDAGGGIAASLEKIVAAVAAGGAVDFVNGHLAAHQLIESFGVVQPVEDLVRRDRFDLTRFNKEALDVTGRYDGKLAALPYAYGGDAAAVAYNKTLFRQGGVAEPGADWSKPWSWDQFREALRRLTRSDGGAPTQVGLNTFRTWYFAPALQWGGQWLSPDYKRVLADSPQTIEAVTRYADLLLKDRVLGESPGAELGPGDPFVNGKAAVAVSCCSPLTLAAATRGKGLEWAFTTMPKGTTATLAVEPVVMGVGASSKNRAEAWELMKFMDGKSRLAVLEARMPALLPDLSPWLKQQLAEWPDSRAESLAEAMRLAKAPDPLRYHPRSQTMTTQIMDPAWREVVAQKQGVADMLRTVKPLLQREVDEHAAARGEK